MNSLVEAWQHQVWLFWLNFLHNIQEELVFGIFDTNKCFACHSSSQSLGSYWAEAVQEHMPEGCPPKKKQENVEVFPKSGTPPPPSLGMSCFFLHFRTLGTFIVGGSPMLKTVKMEVGFGKTPPPFFFLQNSHIFPFFSANIPWIALPSPYS